MSGTNNSETDVTQYHKGELSAQAKAGTRGAAAELAGSKANKLNFSFNHDAFIAAQSFAIITSVNLDDNNIWVTPLFGNSGDIQALSEEQISISAKCVPENDILRDAEAGSPVSLLCIDLNKRIRHRINGVATNVNAKEATLTLDIKEYSPNCPKYINRREILVDKDDAAINRNAERTERTQLIASDREFIEKMDTLWVGSYAPEAGADCNHRGGKPGFIRVTSATTIEWPEYRGNGTFFTSGNFEVHDRAGVTLLDFESGSILQMTGRASVDWEHDGSYEGATRKINFEIEKIVHTDNVTSHRWKRLDYSPYNPEIAGKDSVSGSSDYPMVAKLAKVVNEAENIKTFRFLIPSRVAFLPGQYATFEFTNIPNGSKSEVRTWTLSESPNSIDGDNTLDITVKRVSGGLVTNWLHDHAEIGLEVNLKGIQGELTAIRLDNATQAPMVAENLLFLSAGIGITPNLAMVRGIGAFSLQTECKITMIHVERKESGLISQQELQRRARTYPNFVYTNIISSKQGRLTPDDLRTLVPQPEDQRVYLCGPVLFMNSMTEYLVSMGVQPQHIYTESFEF